MGHALAERWNRSRWEVQSPTDAPGANHTELDGVDCVTAHRCLAVGLWSSTSRWSQPFAEAWSGHGWVANYPRTMAGEWTDASLTAVDCVRARACFGFGSYTDVTGTYTLGEHWNGVGWSVGAGTGALPANSVLTDGVCLSTHHCLAVGNVTNPSGGTSSTAYLVPTHPE